MTHLIGIEINQKQKLADMIALSAEKHQNQFDKSGEPYFLHVMTVMNTVESSDDEIRQIAVGHDLLEDTNITESILRAHFSGRVVDGIISLTKVNGESYDEYKKKVMANPDAVIVKMADLMHNSDLRRLKGTTEKDFARMNKYMQFYTELKHLTLKWKRV